MEVAIEAFVFEPTQVSKYCLFVSRALERYEKIIRRDTTGPAKMRFRLEFNLLYVLCIYFLRKNQCYI